MIGPHTLLQRLKFFNLERNLKIWLGSSLATSNFCLLTQGILEQPHILIYLSVLVKFVFSNLTFTPSFPYFFFLPLLQPNRSPDPSSNAQNIQTRVKSQNLHRLLLRDIKRLCLYRKRDFRITSYSERF